MKKAIGTIIRMADFILPVLVWPAAWILKFVRGFGVHRLPLCGKTLLAVGVFPVRNHYYEPQFDFRSRLRPFSEDRQLPGIDWNVDGQLSFLDSLRFADELTQAGEGGELEFRFDNGAFESGDAEYWYQVIRLMKPRRLIEIGSGHSTLMALKALRRNHAEDSNYHCQHTCVEPFEMPWLERSGVTVVRQRVEELDRQYFADLESGDILFIDSSHVIRPQGDVLFEYLEVLPSLKQGVVVHVHDIFSPKNYPLGWLESEVKFWNEQYLVEAFMSHNSSWQILGALNFLRHHHFARLKTVAPYITEDREPGSFYIRRVAV